MTRSSVIAADVAALLRARNPLLWITTREEARAERYLIEAAASAGYIARTWDVGQGVAEIDGRVSQIGSADPGDTLRAIKELSERGTERAVWIMRDLPPWLIGPGGIATTRQVRNLARALPGAPRSSAQAIIVITPNAEVPPELSGHATVIEWPLPDREEIAAILDAAINSLPDEIRDQAAPNGTRETAIDAAVGLAGEEAQACYAKSLVQLRMLSPAMIIAEKKRIIARERVLEWYDPIPGGLEAVGGLDQLKAWLSTRKNAYTAAARAYGLPSPKGAMLVGIPGCGKSLTAKAIATAWGVPLLKIDLGALRSKFVGESEGNLRRAFKVIEALGRCVVWVDEIEKGLAGATDGGADGGVSKDALGAILTWMQERQTEAFVIATANDVQSLPPELLRKGRFDEVWWVDLPNQVERIEILKAALRAYPQRYDPKSDGYAGGINLGTVAAACKGFTGSEIAALVPEALFMGFADQEREITTEDLITAAAAVVPLAKTAAEKIERLRSWADGKARPATSPDTATEQAQPRGRALDI